MSLFSLITDCINLQLNMVTVVSIPDHPKPTVGLSLTALIQ